MPTYTIRRAAAEPDLDAAFDAEPWNAAETLTIANVMPRSTEHHPLTRARVLYTDEALFVHFHVQDRYVRSVVTEYMGSVCGDSCVEFFFQPRSDSGYFNVEVNAGGTLHLSYIRDCTRRPEGGGFKDFEPVRADLAEQIRIVSSLPATVEPEIAEPTTWHLAYCLPRTVLEPYTGALGAFAGQQWRANFYKCADKTSHPHWLTWAPIGQLNFHRPQDFAPIRFA